MAKEIVLTTFGSLGDLHPYMALGLELARRGHGAVIATSEVYRSKVTGAGLEFRPVRPDLPPPEQAREIIAQVMDARRGPNYLFNRILMPSVRESFEDLLAATETADLLVSHMITFAAPLVAEKRRLRWVSTALQPSVFLSPYDLRLFPSIPAFGIGGFGVFASRVALRVARAVLSSWLAPVRRLRRELGLPAISATDLDMQLSPYLHLALFSRALGEWQPDWPRQTRQAGFCFYDRLEERQGTPKDVLDFLDLGPPPLVFTLGSSAVMSPGSFYRESIDAARILKARALLLVGDDSTGVSSQSLPEGILAAPYAPYSEVFPRSAVIVHQGGVGTTAQALRAGRPQLVVPFAYDQPDNADRVARCGVASVLPRHRYTAVRAALRTSDLMSSPVAAERAENLAKIVEDERGTATACDEIEQQLALGSRVE